MEKMQGLLNLNRLIHSAATKYSNEFIWQDIRLTDEFKNAFRSYYSESGYEIEFFDTTTAITTPLGKYIFLPNQWFAIASYAVDVCTELFRYKELIKKISDYQRKKFDSYIKQLRDGHTLEQRNSFISAGRLIVSREIVPEKVDDSINKLWRFASDYSWWSGQKTIDRGDFYISVVLNMLNLVNASQSYVADIVYAYVNDYHLQLLVKRIDAFTEGIAIDGIYEYKHEEICVAEDVVTLGLPGQANAQTCPSRVLTDDGHVRIKLHSTDKKEIRYGKK